MPNFWNNHLLIQHQERPQKNSQSFSEGGASPQRLDARSLSDFTQVQDPEIGQVSEGFSVNGQGSKLGSSSSSCNCSRKGRMWFWLSWYSWSWAGGSWWCWGPGHLGEVAGKIDGSPTIKKKKQGKKFQVQDGSEMRLLREGQGSLSHDPMEKKGEWRHRHLSSRYWATALRVLRA